MIRDLAALCADDEAAMLADLERLTLDPVALSALLAGLGYEPRPFGTGLYAPGASDRPGQLALLFPLYGRAGLTVRKRRLVGRHVGHSSTIAAGLAALRSVDRRPALLFLLETQAPPAGVTPNQVVSMEGGVVPRIWRHCFGSFDALVRITGQRSHPGLSNTAVNAIESAVPVLQALLHLKAEIQGRTSHRAQIAEAPLQPRLTLSAAHGGSRGSVLPTVFDILLNRRYDPAESVETAFDEIKDVVSSAVSDPLRLEVAITEHDRPVPDPDAGRRSRVERALAIGWGWPQVPFRGASTLMPGATILGGLERAEHSAEADDASTTLDAMASLARTIRALLLDV